MIKPIVQNGHPALRQVADYIEPEKISSLEIQNLITDMKDSLATQKDGVAVAAPQIGVTKQVFIVAPFIFEKPSEHNLVYINPEITFKSKETAWKTESCLSCRWKVGEVKRSLVAKVRAYDEQGNLFEEEADGLLGHIFQHEIDHLHGILFTDKARNLRDMSDAEIAEAQQ